MTVLCCPLLSYTTERNDPITKLQRSFGPLPIRGYQSYFVNGKTKDLIIMATESAYILDTFPGRRFCFCRLFPLSSFRRLVVLSIFAYINVYGPSSYLSLHMLTCDTPFIGFFIPALRFISCHRSTWIMQRYDANAKNVSEGNTCFCSIEQEKLSHISWD